MFDLSFSKLSERFFKGTTWPAAESISHLVDHDHVFCLLYKGMSAAFCSSGCARMAALDVYLTLSHDRPQEMYYRHLYATLAQPTLEQRRKSWENYVRLFNIMLNTQVNMQVCAYPVLIEGQYRLACQAMLLRPQAAFNNRTASRLVAASGSCSVSCQHHI